MGSLVGPALALGCLFFVLSLPFGGMAFAGTLRRWAVFLFLLAFGPSLIFGLLKQATVSGGGISTPGTSTGAVDILAAIGGLVVLSVVAYVILKIRGLSSKRQRDAMGDYFSQRSSGKRHVQRDDQEGRGFPF